MTVSELIVAHQCEGVLHLTINRPQQKNALSKAMYQSLADQLSLAAQDKTIRAVLIAGTEGCFTSGNDLQDFQDTTAPLDDADPVLQFMYALAECPKPVVAAVEGVAIGIGTTLLLHCDLVYAAASARFCLPFVNLGLCPEYASTLLLPRLAGHARASEWLMLGEVFSSADAAQAGLINAVVDDPLAIATEKAERLAKQAPEALKNTKALLKAPVLSRSKQIIAEEFALFSEGLMGPEFKEAVAAFFEKRPADFSKLKF